MARAGADRPYLEQKPPSVFSEYTIGAYLGELDAVIQVASRNIKTQHEAYATSFSAQRNVNALEAVKFFANYHGFVPFIGPTFGAETLRVRETDNGQHIASTQRRTKSLGLLFGWDIRPNKNASYSLRAALRYTPDLYVVHPKTKDKIYFDSIEFNFIQLVWHFC